MRLGTKITQLRKEKHISQEELANILQISRQAVSKWENGQANPDTENLIHLAEIFQVDVNVLVGSQTASAENQTVPKASKLEKAFSRTIWVLTVLFIFFACTTFLFAGLWLTERNLQGTGISTTTSHLTETLQEDSMWREVHMYKGLMKEEVALTNGCKQELLEYLSAFHFVEEKEMDTEKDTSEGEPCGDRMYFVNYYIENTYFCWCFTERGSTCVVTSHDGSRTRYQYQLDWTLIYELDKYMR